MSGHSKWSTIKHKKAKTDQQRGKIFSKISRELTAASRIGGGDSDMNPRLRLAIQKAKDANMANDTIKRAVDKGVGGGDGTALEDITYEAYGPYGVALLIDTLSDNKNRTVSNVRHILSKADGNLATKGAVSYLFEKKGVFLFEPGTDEEQVMEMALSANAEDIETQDDGSIGVQTLPTDFETMRTALSKENIEPASASIEMVPATTVALDTTQAQSIMTLIDQLDDDDDVQNVFGNFEFPSDFDPS
ncbi:MAG: YebC/PmpR family DNA-binding transcriptional regulator [Candidatus Margulisbacteria bacterium]|nr:YebC/PmpR family DNA-binding transcriptional regulator [Candidatus Margulisiibacteriota bacterium]